MLENIRDHYTAEVRALRMWDASTLRAAREWWLTQGVVITGKMTAYNAVAKIDMALRAR